MVQFEANHQFSLQGFNPAEVADHYGDTLTVWDWEKREPVQTIRYGVPTA